MHEMKTVYSIISKINTYIPLVLLPICLFYRLNYGYMLASILIVIWRLITYFNWNYLICLLNYKSIKLIIGLILGCINISCLYSEIILIINILAYCILDKYCSTKKKEFGSCINSILYIIGMLVCCILPVEVLNIYFIICNFYCLFHECNKIRKIRKKLHLHRKKNFTVIVFIHNFQYYMFAFAVPILAVTLTEDKNYAGLLCASSWILFLMKDGIVSFMKKYMSYQRIMSIGWGVNALLLFIVGMSTQINIIVAAFLFQGLSGGISECFFGMDEFQKKSDDYWNIWKKGGIMGCICGGIIAQFVNLKSVFIGASMIAVLECMYLFIEGIRSGRENDD